MFMTDESQSSRERSTTVPPQIERQIDENLRLLYQRQLEGELPETLKELIAKLRDEVQKK